MTKAPNRIAKLEALTCWVVSALALWLVTVEFLHAGPLWRDEVNTLSLSLLPSLGELWQKLDKDSYPLVWFGVVRVWNGLGLAETDQGFRVLGLLMGVLQVAAILWTSRLHGKRWPLLCLAIFALNPIMFHYGTSLRAWGIGAVGLFLMFGWFWSYVNHPDNRRLFFAAAFSLLAVQTLYYNSLALAAIGIAGIMVCMSAGRFRQAAIIALLCGVCALSVLPYVVGPMSRASTWNYAFHSEGVTMSFLLRRFVDCVNETSAACAWGIVALAGAVFIGCCIGFLRWSSPRRRRRALFIVLSMSLLSVIYFLFLLMLQYVTRPWYYVTLLAAWAFMVDRGADLIIRRHSWGRIARIAIVLSVAAWTFHGNVSNATERQTNIDLAANHLSAHAEKEDYIIVAPWYVGVSFARYYHGSAPWTTVPPIGDYTIHRADQALASISEPRNIIPILEKIRQTVTSGHKVWYIGDPNLPPNASMIPEAIPNGVAHGFDWWAQIRIWEANVGYELIVNHCLFERVPLPSSSPISLYEATDLNVFRVYGGDASKTGGE